MLHKLIADTDGSSGSDRNNSEAEVKPKVIPRKPAPPKPAPPAAVHAPASALQNVWIYDFITVLDGVSDKLLMWLLKSRRVKV